MSRTEERGPFSSLVHPRESDESPLTFDEYLALERGASRKHEFVRGRRFAMSGAAEAHNVISVNVVVALATRLRGGPCRVFNSDMMVRIESLDTAYYPDAHVECGHEASPTSRYHEHPMVIVEVFSPSTSRYDRGEKFEDYRALASLRTYLLVSSDRRAVEVRRIDPAGDIATTTLHDGDELVLPELGIAIPVAELYDGSGIEAAAAASRA